MNTNKIILLSILLLTLFTRFYNLMHDSPYFFNPDERNMAAAITRFRLPVKPSDIINCFKKEFTTNQNGRPEGNQGPCTLNPHFFAYGQFPLYLAYASDQIHKSAFSLLPHFIPLYQDDPYMKQESRATPFDHAIFWLRFWSAVASSLTVLFVYLIAKLLFVHCPASAVPRLRRDKLKIENYAALAAACTPSLIQSAHFGTTESLLTFCFVFSIYFSLQLLNQKIQISSRLNRNKFSPLALSASIGIALGSKLTGAFFFIPPALTIFFLSLRSLRERNLIHLLGNWLIGLCIFIGSIFFFILSSPYNFVAWKDFLGTVFGYELSVATGTYLAFYTRQFVNTVPILFQIEKIFPYALGIPIFLIGSLGFLFVIVTLLAGIVKNFQFSIFNFSRFSGIPPVAVTIIRKFFKFNRNFKSPLGLNSGRRQISNYAKSGKRGEWLRLFILTASFLIYFIPNAFLFSKWTRFMTPILPFFALFGGYYVYQLSKLGSDLKGVKGLTLNFIIFAFCTLTFLPGIAFMSIYTHPDTRVSSSYWIWNNLPENSYVLSETANVVDIPVGIPDETVPRKNLEVISFDFYHMDENPEIFENLLSYLVKAHYIFIPSRRIFANQIRVSGTYPLTTKYYQLLTSGKLGFEKIAQFSSFPSLGIGPLSIDFPDEGAEESFTVFDHPVIRIYKKVKPMTKEEYRKMFQI